MKNNFDEEQRAILILMAIFKSTAFSKLRKSFGNLTTCRVNGMNVVREKVDEVKNPNTLKQQKQRKRFPTLMELAGALPEALSLGLAKRPQNNTPENYFMHLNRKAVEVTDELEKTVDYERLVLSQGNRMLPVRMSVTKDTEAGTLTFTTCSTGWCWRRGGCSRSAWSWAKGARMSRTRGRCRRSGRWMNWRCMCS